MLSTNNKIFVFGLGKTGLSVLKFLKRNGYTDEQFICIDTRENPPYIDECQSTFQNAVYILDSIENIDNDILNQCNIAILSPGISTFQPKIQYMIEKGIEVIGDIELFIKHYSDIDIIGITGTNGKSTVTSMTGEILEKAGYNVVTCGNIGVPILDTTTDIEKEKRYVYVIEISSAQLETIRDAKYRISTILNISEDHIDRYPDFQLYIEIKKRIYMNSASIILNVDNEECCPDSRYHSSNRTVRFGIENRADFWFSKENRYFYYIEEKFLHESELKIFGLHNVYNVLAVSSICYEYGLSLEIISRYAKEYIGLPHRCKLVLKTDNGIKWYNDSKGTNVGATISAINGLAIESKKNIILIIGGIGKDANFSKLIDSVSIYVKYAIIFGRDKGIIKKAIEKHCLYTVIDGDIQDIVREASTVAEKNDIVLFSPACASFDMFRDFEHRGEEFEQAVKNRYHCQH